MKQIQGLHVILIIPPPDYAAIMMDQILWLMIKLLTLILQQVNMVFGIIG